MNASHKVILASAGTGKTFQLSNRYIGLLAHGAAPEQILATTFTRKAAGEILERILLRLADGALSEKEAAGLSGFIGREHVTSADCLEWLALLVSRLDRLQVRTLDSFFVHLATLFGHDLGLPPGWSLADESDVARLRDDAVAGMTAAMDPSEAATLIRDLKQSGEGLTRSTHEVLRDRVVQDAYGLHRAALPGAWDQYQAPPAVDERVLARALEDLEVVQLPTTKAGAPSSRWENARDAMLGAARSGDWRSVVGKGFVKALLVNGGKFYNTPIPDDVVALLRPLCAQAAHELLASLVALNRSYGTLLDRYGKAEAEAKLALRRQGFDDIPVALCSGPSVDSAAMSHRLDGRVEHLLLDEFQDTSVQQWRVLEPLARHLVELGEHDRSFFCVGDVKQSIYGWRGGESRLLAELSERLALGEPETMEKSYRSSPVVLNTVNQIFKGLPLSPVFSDEPAREAAAERWLAGFNQHTAFKALPGHGAYWEVPCPDSSADEAADRVVAAAAVHVQRMVARAPYLSVGVLVRRKKIATKCIAALRALGVDASGEGGTPLTDCEAVRLALSTLQLADHPGDSAAAFHLANSPLAEVLQMTDPGDGPARRRLSKRVRRALLCKGYGPWLADLATTINACPGFGERDRRRFAQLVDLGLSAGPRAALRPADFCRQVRVTSVEDSSSAKVRVMTVHASKGLEFDAVVLPDLDGDLARSPKLLVGQPDPWQGPQSLLAGVSKELLPLDENLAQLSGETWGRNVEEALCVLYVALTRAARSLDLFVAQPSPAKKGASVKRTFAKLVGTALKSSGDGLVGAAGDECAGEAPELYPVWVHPESDPEWWLALASDSSGQEAIADHVAGDDAPQKFAKSAVAPTQITLRPSTRSRFLSRKAPSAAEGGGVVRPSDLLAGPSNLGAMRGSAAHLWFEQIEWLEDFSMTDDELLTLARRELGAHEQLPQWLEQWRGWLEGAATKSLLSRTDHAPEVWRERKFLLSQSPSDNGTPQLLGGTFDRVHVWHEDGRPARAEVIDFKSDAIADGDVLAQKREHYAPQLDLYRTAAAQLTGLDPSSVRCVLLFAAVDGLEEV